jgi:hypothetical protein
VINLVLDAVAKERGNVVVADWAAVASTRGYLAADGVHLSAAGERAYAKVIAAATERVAWLPATVPQRATAAR